MCSLDGATAKSIEYNDEPMKRYGREIVHALRPVRRSGIEQLRLQVPGMGAVTPSVSSVQQMLINAANSAGIPPSIALGVAYHESRFQANAQNPNSSAAGVMQLLAGTQQTLGVTNPYDAQQNVDAGVSLLARYYQQYGNWPQALQAYADGPATVQQGLPPSAMAQEFISSVTSYSPPAGLDLGTVPSLNLATDTSGLPNPVDLVDSLTTQAGSFFSGLDFTDPVTIGLVSVVGIGLVLLAREI